MNPKVSAAKRKAARERLQKIVSASLKHRKRANLRRIAEQEPQEVGAALAELGQAFQDAADVLSGLSKDTETLQENLDLAEPAKQASLKVRVAARRNYAKSLRRIANDEPEEIGAALSEVYNQLDEVAAGIEALAENFGLQLEAPDRSGETSAEAESGTTEEFTDDEPEDLPEETEVSKAAAYGDRRDFPKIDLFVNGKWAGVTTWSPNCREAIENYKKSHQPGADQTFKAPPSPNVWDGELQPEDKVTARFRKTR